MRSTSSQARRILKKVKLTLINSKIVTKKAVLENSGRTSQMRTISILVIASALCYQARVEPILATFFFHPSTAQAAPETQDNDSQRSRETFHMISGSEGRAEDGTVLSMQLFEGSSGVRVAFTKGKFAT